jgi:hypothetical protein
MPDRTVVAWGSIKPVDDFGQLDVPSGLDDVRAVAAGADHTLALRWDGTVVAWGRNDDNQCSVPNDLEDVIQISAGTAHSLALREDGTVCAWGSNAHGQLDVPDMLDRVIEIAAGGDHGIALRSDGRVVGWGADDKGQSLVPDGLSGIQAIGAGTSHSLAVTMDGNVVGWGDNDSGQLDIPQTLEPTCFVGGGARYSIARTVSGRLVAWGVPRSQVTGGPGGQLRRFNATAPGGSNHHAVAAGPDGVVATLDLCPPCTPADFNRDRTVDHLDLIFLFEALGRACRRSDSAACSADLNHDGAVGLDDLSELFMAWGPCP